MNLETIGKLRLKSQLLNHQRFIRPKELVTYMGAMQAQDFTGALWSIGLRCGKATLKTVEQAIKKREIIRSWPMRGTLHFVAADNLRWMLKLLAPRVIANSAGRHRQLGLNDEIFLKSQHILEKHLADGSPLMRHEVYRLLEEQGISCTGQRGIHILGHLARLGYICHGNHIGKQATYVWLDSWIAQTEEIDREEALAKIARIYFYSHGPATLQDFVWWTGLKVVEAREAIHLIRAELLERQVANGTFWMRAELLDTVLPKEVVTLLPGFDEFILGYTDRTVVVGSQYLSKLIPGNNGMFMPTIVIDGQVSGLWKRTITNKRIEISIFPFENFGKDTLDLVKAEAECYGAFMERKLSFKI